MCKLLRLLDSFYCIWLGLNAFKSLTYWSPIKVIFNDTIII